MSITPELSFFPWKPACWLRVQGPDAFSFLQGQFSNDLRGLAGGLGGDSGVSGGDEAAVFSALARAVYGLWLDRKGRILGDGFVLRVGEECFFICSYETSGAALRAHLESFIIADEVELFDETAEVLGLTFFLKEGVPFSLDLARAGRVFEGRRGARAIECVGPAAACAELIAQLNPKMELSAAEMERRRILAKVPAVPRDLGSADLPQEGGASFEQSAVSYTKGCYLGQEVMSRLRSMGRVRRSLVLVRSEGIAPSELPAPLYLGEKRVGEMRSVVADETPGGFVGLASVSLHGLPTGSLRLSLSANGPAALSAELPTA
ncbi:YgfZ/GcvT domain-containing protein [Cephaloticoccus capnophilus]|nr:hypothetical protein [Cephaloticoccus capnophilus]